MELNSRLNKDHCKIFVFALSVFKVRFKSSMFILEFIDLFIGLYFDLKGLSTN